MPTPGSGEDRTKLVLGRIKHRRGRISFTYTLTLLENAFELMYPWAIGIAINGMIAGTPHLLIPLVAIWFAHIITGGFRQLYDTRLFSRLYADIATDIVVLQRKSEEDVSGISARVEMAEEVTEFFETDMPVIFATAVSLFGSLALLFLYDVWAGLIMMSLLLPVSVINIIMGRRALRMNTSLNSQWEKQVDVITTGKRRASWLHFGRLAQWRIRLSDIDVASWTLTELLTLGATILVLIRVASIPGALTGDIFASLVYVLRIQSSFDQIPGMVQQGGRLIDIRRRIKSL